jgi:hypothetical protein
MNMKNLFFLLIIFLVAQSCSTLRQANSMGTSNGQSGVNTQEVASSPKFIENVSIRPVSNYEMPKVISKKKVDFSTPSPIVFDAFIEKLPLLQFKYAILENVPVEELMNEKLLSFMEEWYGTKYRFGGTIKGGIDCSAFSSTLMSNVFGINGLPRMAKDQYAATARVPKEQLQEGDLVFFHTYGRARRVRVKGRRRSKIIPAPFVTHVGVYLRNNKFIHASVSGVMISDLSEGYYASHYVGGGRVEEPSMKEAVMNGK